MSMLATRFASNAARLDGRGAFLDETDLRRHVPSIFAEEAHGSRSDRYAFVPTVEIVRALADEGYRPTFACQARPRDADRYGTTKHMIRFRREDAVARGECPEIIGINAHGGEASFQLLGGVFRFVCCNGLVIGDRLEELRIRHSGNIIGEVVDGAARVLAAVDQATGAIDRMKTIDLKPAEQEAFAQAAAIARFDLEENEKPPVTLEQLLRPRRTEDVGADLWRTFNRVQEATLRGGLHGMSRNANNQIRRFTTRPVNGIDESTKLNRALWTLAERMADLKTAA